MQMIDEVSQVIIWLIRAGAAFRVCYSFFRMIATSDETAMYQKRIRNVLVFYVLAESIWIIKNLILEYYT